MVTPPIVRAMGGQHRPVIFGLVRQKDDIRNRSWERQTRGCRQPCGRVRRAQPGITYHDLLHQRVERAGVECHPRPVSRIGKQDAVSQQVWVYHAVVLLWSVQGLQRVYAKRLLAGNPSLLSMNLVDEVTQFLDRHFD